ncbi:putative porin [Fluviicoccus keumensis]|uniref:Putative porin n=1 Tax=Fluviicoccus keumensis TaxID=1435465 RepID=A0A4Q7Z6H7_9GAMM|nr:porin [Fluviicoccus keumensis]RZU45259.1 putative porin [Fluviicoccus keumensis]
MKRNLLALAVGAAVLLPLTAQATPTVYGRLNLSVDYTKMNDKTVSPSVKSSNWEVNSNASRVGIKGSEKLSDDFTAVYKAEWEVSGDTQGVADLTGRERYVGLKHGNLGTIRLGAIDSPLKTSEDQVDVFNDLNNLDMKNFISGQTRLNNSINYVSPKILDVFGANVTLQPGESGKLPANSKNHLADAYSAAFSYEDDSLYLSAAFDKKVSSTISANAAANLGIVTTAPRDATRLVARYKMGDFVVAGLIQKSKLNKSADKADESAIVLSAAYTMDKLTYKGEIISASVKGNNAAAIVAAAPEEKDKISLIGVGVDYAYTQNTKVFANLASGKDKYSNGGGSETGMQLGTGVEVRF